MNQKGFANIILVVVIVILVGAVGYFALVKKSEPIAQQPTPTSTQTITPTKPPVSPTPTTPSETANWKTYTNTKYGISIKYPPYNNELKALGGNISVEVLDDTKPEEGPGAFWTGVAQRIWHERYEKKGNYKIGDECVNNEQETCRVYSLNPLVLKILENYADPYPDPYKLVFPTEKFQLTVGPLPHNTTEKELSQIIFTFKFTK